MNFVIDLAHVESQWLSGRASERGIRRSEVRFLWGLFSLSHARDKTNKHLSQKRLETRKAPHPKETVCILCNNKITR